MRARFLAVLVAALGFGLMPGLVRAQDAPKPDDSAKKDAAPAKKACCGDDEKCEKDGAGCEGCGATDKETTKRITCKACDNSVKGPCEACQTALKDGKVHMVPVSGMACSMCEGAVATKLEKVEGIEHYAVSHRFNAVAVFVEPGKTVKLSDVVKALAGTKFKVDEDAKLSGKYTLRLDGVTDAKVAASICETICKALGIESCKNCSSCFDAKTATFTIDATGKNVTIKSIKDKLAESKLQLAEIEFHGAAKAEGKSSS
jgi:hypothetical protein